MMLGDNTVRFMDAAIERLSPQIEGAEKGSQLVFIMVQELRRLDLQGLAAIHLGILLLGHFGTGEELQAVSAAIYRSETMRGLIRQILATAETA